MGLEMLGSRHKSARPAAKARDPLEGVQRNVPPGNFEKWIQLYVIKIYTTRPLVPTPFA